MADKVCKEGDEILRKLLATAVRSIQWSYAIFWTISSKQPGVLQWGEGYYNGDIKTRRTVLNKDVKGNDEIGWQRCDQLRELYQSLLSSNTNKQIRRPLAALSPEDLTNVEWFYLVCMSFVFNIGQGLPGTSFVNGRTIWLCNAHSADTSIFWRSLLAKSAGIKTVVCFPLQSGVIELGVTDMVQEDLELVQHVRASVLKNSSPILPWRTTSLVQFHGDDALHADLPPLVVRGEEVTPSGSSNEADTIVPSTDDARLFKGLNGEVSQAQSWFSLEDRVSHYVHTLMSTSDCISQGIVNPGLVPPSPKTELMIDPSLQEKDNQEWKERKAISVTSDTPISKDLHFRNVLSSIFKTSNQELLGLSTKSLEKTSSFISWKKGGKQIAKFGDQLTTTPQNMLKKVLFDVPLMHKAHSNEAKEDSVTMNTELRKPELDVSSTNHVLSERRRREKVNKRFAILRSLLPSISKVDKISILDDTIAYLKELERRVKELDSCQLASYAMKKKRKAGDIEERTSGNYGDYDMNAGNVVDKSKAHGIDEGADVCGQACTSRDSLVDNTLLVRLVENEIFINIRCPWRDGLLLEIVNTMSSLQLDSQSIQSSTVDDFLSLTMHTWIEGSTSVSVGVITQELQRVIRSC